MKKKRTSKKIMLVLSIVLIFLVMGAASAGADDNSTDHSVSHDFVKYEGDDCVLSYDENNAMTDESADAESSTLGAASATTDDSNSTNDDEVLAVEDAASEEVVSTDTSNENTDVLADEESTTGSFSELEQYINDNKGYEKTVYLNKDYAFNNESDNYDDTQGIYITTFVNIEGNNHIIDAKGTNYIFNIIGKQVTVKNIKFINTNNKAITVTSSNVNLINCTFYNNTNRAVSLSSSALECVIDGCKFINGQGLYVNVDEAIIRNSLFENNTQENGAGISIGHDMRSFITVDNCTFINNTAATYGGAIYNNAMDCSVVYIKNSKFIRNKATHGGAIYNVQYYFQSSPWKYYDTYITLNITGSTFDSNKATRYLDIYGNYTNDTTTIFTNSSYIDPIDALFDTDNETITLDKNYTLTNKIIITKLNANLAIKGNGFTIDANGNQGLVITIYRNTGKNLKFNDFNIINANTSASGGAINVYIGNTAWNGGVTMRNCNFINNTASNGGAVYFNSLSGIYFDVTNCNFYNNTATGTGGALYVRGNSARLRATSINCINNTAKDAGAVYGPSATGVYIKNSNFINNSAVTNGAVNVYRTPLTDCVFINNTAYSKPIGTYSSRGGDISNDYGNVELDKLAPQMKPDGIITLIKDNYYTNLTFSFSEKNVIFNGNGSVIYGNGQTFLSISRGTNIIENVTLVNCTISRGSYGSLNIKNVTFINCTGTILSVEFGCNAHNLTFINCTGNYINNDYCNVNYTNINIDGVIYNNELYKYFNTTTSTTNINETITLAKGDYKQLGSIYFVGLNTILDGSNSNITFLCPNGRMRVIADNSTIKNLNLINGTNSIYISYTSSTAGINNNPIHNKAAADGTPYDSRVLYNSIINVNFINSTRAINIVDHNNVKVIDCNFNNIYATGNGGAIQAQANLTVNNCNFNNIYATGDGGAIYLSLSNFYADARFNITNSKFNNITAIGYGGSLYIPGHGDINNCTFENSNAYTGGCVYQSNVNCNVSVSKSSFDGCKVISTAGGIYCEGMLIIDDCEFNNNTADNCAGFLTGTGLTLTNSNFTNNDATLGGAGSVDGDNSLIENSTFTDNNAMVGGGLNIQGNNAILKGLTFKNNTASAVSSAVQISGNDAKLVGCTIEGSSAPEGAAIKINGNNANISDCTFKDNTATEVGGSMLTVDGNGTNLEKVNVTGNNGHGITLNGDNATITDVIIADNDGTAITVNGNSAHVENTDVTGNNGDAVVINGDDATFSENTVSGNNGTAMTVNGNNATLEKNNVTGNDGDGIVINGNGTTATENTVSGNKGTGVVLNGNDVNMVDNALGNNSNATGDISIGENSNMNTPEKKDELINNNTGVKTFSTESDLKVIVSPSIIHADENITVTITMATGAGTARIILNGKEYNLTNDSAAVFDPLAAGDYNVSVEFTANTGFTPVDSYVIPVHVQNWNFTELQEAIVDAVRKGENLTLEHDYVAEYGEDSINIVAPITIDGNNHTIDANNQTSIFNIANDDVTIKDMTLTGAIDGTIHAEGNNITIDGVSITNITGDAISAIGNNITIDGVDVTNTTGIAINVVGNDTEVSDVTLEDITGQGIVIEGDNADVSDLTANNVTQTAIAIIGDDANVDNVNLTNIGGEGINIAGDNSQINNVTAEGIEGTAIDVSGENTTISSVDLTDVGDGIEFEGTGKAEVTGVKVTGIDNGTAIDVEADSVVIDDVELSNVDDGVKVNATETAKVTNVKADDVSGVAVNVTAKDATIENIDLNNVTGEAGVKLEADNVKADNITVKNSITTAVDVVSDNATISDVNVTGNTGNAVKVTGDNADLSDVSVENNKGDAITVDGDNADIKDIAVSDSTGTAITVNGDNATVNGVTLNNDDGTGVKTNGSNSNVDNVVANGGKGTVVDVTGANATINGVTSNHHEGTPVVAPSDAKISNTTVNKYDTGIAANAALFVITYGGDYKVTLSPALAGKTITFTLNGKVIGTGVTDVSGVASIKLTKAILGSAGKKTIVASFAGDDVYKSSSASAVITVNKEATKITGKAVKKTYKKSKTKKIKITLKNSKNKAFKGKFKIVLKVNKKLKGNIGKKLKKGYTFSVKFNKKGVGIIKLTNKKVKGFKKGTYKFTVTYKGNALYKGATKKNIKMKVK